MEDSTPASPSGAAVEAQGKVTCQHWREEYESVIKRLALSKQRCSVLEADLAHAKESHSSAAQRADAAEQAMAPVIEQFATKEAETARPLPSAMLQ